MQSNEESTDIQPHQLDEILIEDNGVVSVASSTIVALGDSDSVENTSDLLPTVQLDDFADETRSSQTEIDGVFPTASSTTHVHAGAFLIDENGEEPVNCNEINAIAPSAECSQVDCSIPEELQEEREITDSIPDSADIDVVGISPVIDLGNAEATVASTSAAVDTNGEQNTLLNDELLQLPADTLLPPSRAPVTAGVPRIKGKRHQGLLMLAEDIRHQISMIFNQPAELGHRKISPMWENPPWIDYLVFLTASIPKDDCVNMVEDMIKFFAVEDVSAEAEVKNEEHTEEAEQSLASIFRENGSVEFVQNLLQDFFLFVLTKVPGRMEDESKAREQAAIVTSVYYRVLSAYMNLVEGCEAASNQSVDATAAFFRACLPASERARLESEPHATANGVLTDELRETASGESTSQSPSSAAHQTSSESTDSATGGGGSGIGSLLRKKLHLDSKSKHVDSSETNAFITPTKTRSPLKRFSSKSNSSKHKLPEAQPKSTQEVLEVVEGDDYTVYIQREMLGLTVENVLERTIIRTVLPHGAAKKSGAKVGSLIVQVGGVKTYNLTHFETIDELRRSNRPLKLDLRMISEEALNEARGEMGRLIRGGEFGKEHDTKSHAEGTGSLEGTLSEDSAMEVAADEHSESYPTNNAEVNTVQSKNGVWQLVSYRWNLPMKYVSGTVVAEMRMSKKEKAVSKAGENLVALLTLFLMGIDYELYHKVASNIDESVQFSGLVDKTLSLSEIPQKQSLVANTCMDVGKTMSKLLFEYVSKHVQVLTEKGRTIERCKVGGGTGYPNITTVGSPPRQPQQPQLHSPPSRHRPKAGKKNSRQLSQNPNTTAAGVPLVTVHTISPTEMQQSPLWQVGDVLHRARSFLADCSLKSANVIQTQLIALLCDLLDLDSEMELSQFDEESHSPGSAGNPFGARKGGMQDDLGCAGSLLKLIIRNSAEAGASHMVYDRTEGAKGGNLFLAVVHRLAASRSPPARITACSLGPVLWGHLDFAHTLQLRGVITRSLHDVDVNVRRSTAAVLHEIAELVFDPRSVPWLVLMCERAMTDPEPPLRAAAMTLTWHLAEHLPNAFLGDARKGSRSRSRLPARTDPTFAEVYLLQCKLLPVATRLAEDRAASVRLAVAAQCDRLCSALGDHWFAVIIDLLQALLGDSDERVRGEAVLCVPRLAESVLTGAVEGRTKQGVSVLESLLPHMLKLAKDPASSVRAALARSSGELLTLLVGLSIIAESEVPAEEGTSGVQIINAESLAEFKEHVRHVDETLIPLVQQLLNDKDVEVTSAALRAVTNASRGNVKELRSRLPQNGLLHGQKKNSCDLDVPQSPMGGRKEHQPVVVPVLSEGQILRLLPTLTDLASSALWRVRQSAVEIVPALLGCTQRLETRTAIAQLCVTLMGDSVDAVRRTAAECLCLGGGSLGGNGGGEWLVEIVIPIVKQCRDSQSSKQRLLCLKMIEVLVRNQVCTDNAAMSSSWRSLEDAADQKSTLRELLEVAASLSCDKIVNVRLNVGRVFGDVVDEFFNPDDVSFIISTLEEQLESEASRGDGGDRDVLYFAESAMARANSVLSGSPAYISAPSTPRRHNLAAI